MNDTPQGLPAGTAASGPLVPPRTDSLSAHRVALAREVLDDIELSRLPIEGVLLKASRLARLTENTEVQQWLEWELGGYFAPISGLRLQYAIKTGRLLDATKMTGFWEPLAGIAGIIRAKEMQLAALKLPDVNFAPSSANPNEYVVGMIGQHVQTATAPVNQALGQMATITAELAGRRQIASKVTALLHSFVSSNYYELTFRGLAETIFERHKREVDLVLVASAASALQKIPSVVDRLTAGDPEAVSQAMTTRRRILEAFADAVAPPSDEKVKVGSETWDVGPGKYLNRLRYYLIGHCKSDKRRERLKHAVTDLNDRFSAGTHADVSPEEAHALFVLLYVTLGELLMCRA